MFKLNFTFYIPSDGFSKLIKTHWFFLRKYASIFDCSQFNIISENQDDKKIESIKRKILGIGYENAKICLNGKELTNTNQENFDGLTFFASSCGIENLYEEHFGYDNLNFWISSMYFYNLNFIDDVKDKLSDETEYTSYGTYLAINEMLKNNWEYAGNFYWTNENKNNDSLDIKFAYSRQNKLDSPLLIKNVKETLKSISNEDDYNEFLKVYKKVSENKICVYTISKNETKNVERWYESMSDADYIAVLDTGSEDDTVEKLRNLGVHVEQKIIKPWRFDVARNESMKLIPEDCNILVCTDLDEYFMEGWAELLKDEWDEEKNNSVLYYKYVHEGLEVFYNFIHGRNWYWKYPVHEEPFKKDENDTRQQLDLTKKLFLYHNQDTTKSRNSYFDLLKLRKIEFPNDYRGQLHYLSECESRGLFDEILDTSHDLIKRKNEVGLDMVSLWFLYFKLATTYWKLNDNENAEKYFRLALETDKENLVGYIEYAKFLHDSLDKKPESITILKLGLKNYKKISVWTYFMYAENEIYDLLSIYSYYDGNKLESLAYAYKAWSIDKTDKRKEDNLKLIENLLSNDDYANI